jgi:diguanylate cyclase (GGDEF)-like protein
MQGGGEGRLSITEYLQRQPKWTIVVAGGALTLCLGFIDYITGPDLSFVIFYLLPVFLVAWYADRGSGFIIALLSGIAWFSADVLTMPPSAHPLVTSWNVVTKIGFFLIVNQMVSSLRGGLERERQMARRDHLTGVANSRHFAEIASQEIRRAGRYQHPFTLAYLDIDDFKSVNDAQGHSAGDALLVAVASSIRDAIRSTDVVARLGGDEFAVLLPETGFEASAVVIRKVSESLHAVMRRKGWPVTFSIGVVTFRSPPESVDSMIRAADEFMYAVKRAGKDRVLHCQVNEKAA